MKTIFDQTVNGKSVKLELNDKTGALWLTRDGREYNECFRELYYVSKELREYGIELSVEQDREISAQIAGTPSVQPSVSPAAAAQEDRDAKFSKFVSADGGVL